MNDKEKVAIHVAKQVEDGMLVGLGTGSTADYFIAELGRRRRVENLQFTAVPSSVVSMRKAQELAIPLRSIEQLTQLDLYVDGADEVAPDNTLLKGRGYDLVKEKLLAKASDRFLVLVEQSKMVEHIGDHFPIPVEIMPFAWQLVQRSLERLGGTGELRQTNNGLVVTSHGSLVLDVSFESKQNSAAIARILNDTPGVVEHGIFSGLASSVFLVSDGVVREINSAE